jgi:hypothetical protein
VPAQYTSGSLAGGFRGRGGRSLRAAHSLILTKGLIRIPIKVPANADFTVKVVKDPPGCNSDPTFNKDPVTGEQILSMYRRPIISASLRFKVPDDNENGKPTNVMWDGREPSLRTQAISATLGHAQSPVPPTAAQIDEIVDFETKFFSAQLIDRWAGRLDANAEGGPVHLAGRSTQAPPGFPAPPPPPFTEYTNWANLAGSLRAARQASIARGQELFNTKTFFMSNVAGTNDFEFTLPPNGPTIVLGNNLPFTCGACHGFPHAGSELIFPPHRDVGTGGQAAAGSFQGPMAGSDTTGGVGPAPAKDLPLFEITCTGTPHPFYGARILTNDPGTGLITGKCKDIGKKTVPALRGLASRAPFFSDGSAKNLAGVIDFYNRRFNIGLTTQEKTDLVNFMAAL